MLKITIKSTMEKIYDFIDNRLVLVMAEKKIHCSQCDIQMTISKDKIVQNVQKTVFYLEKEPNRSALIIYTSEKKGEKGIGNLYGVALRKKNAQEFDFYIDLFAEALKKGILEKEQIGNRQNIVMNIVYTVLGLALVIGGLTLLPVFILAIIFLIFTYPILFLLEKKKFKHKQNLMHTIISIFENEFITCDKKDTKDWISLGMRVKEGVKDFY